MFTRDNAVMILIDVQGRLAQIMHDKDRFFEKLSLMIRSMIILDIPIIWMEQIPKNLGPTTEAIAGLMPQDQSPIEKSSFSCCNEPDFMDRFNSLGRTQVFLTGIETHICVFQTGMDLLRAGHRVQVVTDCVASREPENKQVGIQRLMQAGVEPTCFEMAVFELMGAAKGDDFKQIVKMIK